MKIHSAILKVMADVGSIEKGRKNIQQGYAFRGIDDAYAAFQPLFVKHGMFVMPTVLKSTREERQTKSGGTMTYTTLEVKHSFFADDGSSLDAITVGEAADSGDKSSNKAMSAAMKYALLEVFCVPTEADNDTENHSPEFAPRNITPPARQAEPASAKIKSGFTDADRQRFIGVLMDKQAFPPESIQAFAVAKGIILSSEQADTDWPLHRLPENKAAFTAFCGEIKKFIEEQDNVPM